MNKDGPDQTKENKELPLEEMCWEVIPTESEKTQYLNQVKPWEKLFYSFVGLTDLGVAYICIDFVINSSSSANKTLALIISSTSIGAAIACYESFNGRDPIKSYLKKRRKKKGV